MSAPESPGATLGRAASLLREKASAATRGPWEAEDGKDCWKLFGAVTPGLHPLQLIKAPKHGTPYAEYWPTEADSAWITTMNPFVGLALADLLGKAATEARECLYRDQSPGDPEWCCKVCDGMVALDCHLDPALTVARAFLGEGGTP